MNGNWKDNESRLAQAVEALFTESERSQIQSWSTVTGLPVPELVQRIIEQGFEAVRRNINDQLLNESLISRYLPEEEDKDKAGGEE